MRRYLLIISALFSLIAPAAQAANSTVSAMTAASALGGTELLYVVQGAADRKGTPAQFATYIYGLASGDCTISGVGAVVCTKTNGVAFTALATTAPGTGVVTALGISVGTAGAVLVNGGALGTPSSGVGTNLTGTAAGLTAGNVTTNANLTGAITSVGNAASLGSFSSANLLAALTTKTGTGNAVFGTAPTIDSLNATTAATLAFITGSTQCLHVNTSGVISGTGSDCGAGGGAVASVTGGQGITCTPTTGAVVCGGAATRTDTTGTTDTITNTQRGTIITESNASAVAVTITNTSFVSTDYISVKNKGAGLATYTPSSGQIDGAGTFTLKQNQSADLYFDGTNWWTLPGRPTNVACADLTNGGTACPAATGTSGHTLPFLDGNNTHSGVETFGSVIGTVTTQSGTTYTFASSDCGTTVRFSNASAVTATIPQGLTVPCSIAVEQAGAGAVSVNGSAVTPATLHSAHSYTKTSAQWAIIGIFIESTNVAILTGDGA